MNAPATAPTAAIAREELTGLVLAGGRGSRMGGADKGLQDFHGQPLAQHALARLAPQVGALMLSANRHLDRYAAFGVPVWPDAQDDFAGPLAGLLAGLSHCDTPYLLSVPCDAPFFPADLAERLGAALCTHDAEIAMAVAPDEDEPATLRRQPVFCLLRTSLCQSLAEFLNTGQHKVGAWAARHRLVEVAFDQPGDDPRAFANLNTLAELQDWQHARR